MEVPAGNALKGDWNAMFLCFSVAMNHQKFLAVGNKLATKCTESMYL